MYFETLPITIPRTAPTDTPLLTSSSCANIVITKINKMQTTSSYGNEPFIVINTLYIIENRDEGLYFLKQLG